MIALFLFSVLLATLQSEPVQEKPQCAPCKSVLEKSMKYIEKYGVEAFKQLLISQYCSKLPSSAKAVCEKAVEIQAQKLLHWIESQLNPEQICQYLGFCEQQLFDESELKLFFQILERIDI